MAEGSVYGGAETKRHPYRRSYLIFGGDEYDASHPRGGNPAEGWAGPSPLSEMERFRTFLAFGRGVGPSTQVSYMKAVGRFRDYTARRRDSDLPAFSRANLRPFLRYLKGRRLSVATIRAYFSGLRAWGDFLIEEGTLADNPAETVLLPRMPARLPKLLNHDEIARLLDHGFDPDTCVGLRDRAVLEFLYATGVRSAELCRLKASDLELGAGYAKVFGKGLKERHVFFHRKASRVLERYLSDVRPKLLPPAGSGRLHPRTARLRAEGRSVVFLSRLGTPLSNKTLCQIVKDAGARAGIEQPLHTHMMRHSFATHLVEGGADLVSLAAMLGHSDLNTLEVYVHLSQKHLRKAAALHPRNRGS